MLDRFHPVVPLVLRVVLGGLFVWHGIDKFDAGIDMVKQMFTMWGVPWCWADRAAYGDRSRSLRVRCWCSASPHGWRPCCSVW